MNDFFISVSVISLFYIVISYFISKFACGNAELNEI